jgi:pyruvate dehydrogenase E2 component (dihydrolipoamide acetyltransferase)
MGELIDVRVPQMGEGLQEVRIVQLLRRAGDTIQRDDVLYSMETDKANVEVEAPEQGLLHEWLVQ